jgi:hypothetical protein
MACYGSCRELYGIQSVLDSWKRLECSIEIGPAHGVLSRHWFGDLPRFASNHVSSLFSQHVPALCCLFYLTAEQLKARLAKLFYCSLTGGSNPRGDASVTRLI